MAGFTGGSPSGPDYVQPGKPANPDALEKWYDTDADPDGDGTAQGQMKIYGTDGQWHAITVESHQSLSEVLEGDHHEWPISPAGLTFDPATQTELNSHAGTADVHHSPPTGTTSDGVGQIIEQTPYIDYNNSAGVDQPGQSLDGDTGTYADTNQAGEWIEYWPAQGPEMVHGVDIQIYDTSNSIPLELRDSMGNVLETKTAQPQTGFDSIRFSTVGRSVRAAATDRTLIEEFRLLQTFAAPHNHGVTQ